MCDFCRNFDFGVAKVHIDKFGASIFLAGGSSRYPVHDQFNYCPNCGASKTAIQRARELQAKSAGSPWNY